MRLEDEPIWKFGFTAMALRKRRHAALVTETMRTVADDILI